MFSRKGLSSRLSVISFVAFVLGLALGFAVPGLFPPISFIGDVYINLLKLIVVPLLMTEIFCAVFGAAQTVARRLVGAVLLFAAMFVVSFLLTALVIAIVRPGVGVEQFAGSFEGTLAAATLPDFMRSIVPSSILSAMTNGAILPCTLFAFLMGIAAARTKAERAAAVTDDFRRIFERILSYFMWLTPFGVFTLMGNAAASYGTALVGVTARYVLLAWGCCALVTVLVMLLPVCVYAKISPIAYIRRVGKIWLITLSTCSSAATLPHTMRVCNEEFHVPEAITNIVVPMGCTIHMCGGAVSFCLLGLFTMQAAGIPVTLPLFLYMLLVATLMNMAAPGIPGGGIVLGATYLSILGAPTGFIGVYGGIYRLLDMAYTTVNVTGDITANVLFAEAEKRGKDRQTLDRPLENG